MFIYCIIDVCLLYYKCQRMSVFDGSYIDSPDSIKSKKAIINPINKNDNGLNMMQHFENILKKIW